MPTKPYEPLLYRELRKVEAKEIIEIACPLLHEEINYATNAYKRCYDSVNKEPEVKHLPIFTLFHHLIAMIDGIEVLISESCAIPAIPLLRSAFETILGIDYMLENNYEQRAFSWLVSYIHDRKSKYELLDSNQEKGKEFQKDLTEDEINKFLNFSSIPDTSEIVKYYDLLLKKPHLSSIESEYLRLKKIKHRKPNWYSLFNGPSNIENLAKHLNRGAQYNILYRQWASVSHAVDLSNYLFESNGKVTIYKPIRNTEDLNPLSSIASSFMLHGIFKFTGRFRPGENKSLGKWYVLECRKSHLALTKEP